MGKRMRRTTTISRCVSPRFSLTPHSSFCWYEDDVWTEIAKHLDGKSLVKLAVTCRWFYKVIMEDCVWKYACLRDLQVPYTGVVKAKWIRLYAASQDGSHYFMFREKDKHLYWMRIGSFLFDSPVAFLTEKLALPRTIPGVAVEKMVESRGFCVLNNIKTGIWIADFQLVRCLHCDLDTCDGTMQTLEARHIELFLNEGFQNGSWDYELLGTHNIKKHMGCASGGIFDVSHILDKSTSDIFNLKSWVGKPKQDWHPKAKINLHAVAVNTNLQDNEGLQIKYHAMRAGDDGEVVSIRISQQLI